MGYGCFGSGSELQAGAGYGGSVKFLFRGEGVCWVEVLCVRMDFATSVAGGSVVTRVARYWKMGAINSRKGLPLLLASPISPEE